MWYRGVSAGGFALAWACFGNSAWAAEARLSYERAAGAESCPDVAGLRDAVRSRLGYDPFTETAPASLVASVAATDTGLRGVVKSFDASGVPIGERELTVRDETCEELVQAGGLDLHCNPELGGQRVRFVAATTEPWRECCNASACAARADLSYPLLDLVFNGSEADGTKDGRRVRLQRVDP